MGSRGWTGWHKRGYLQVRAANAVAPHLKEKNLLDFLPLGTIDGRT